MGKITILFGVLLVALGVVGFVATGSEHYTALIPAAIGGALGGLGAMALAKPSLRMHVMHAAVMIGLLSFLAMIPAVFNLVRLMSGQPLPHAADKPAPMPAAVYAKSAMCGLMLVYVILCVRSFIAARKARQTVVL